MSHPAPSHDDLIVETFTKTAAAFADMPAHSDAASMRLMLDAARIGRNDRVLDVACGPGLVACAAAAMASEVIGVDMTPGMIDRAREFQQEKGVKNASFQLANATALPFEAGAFSVVISRYAFHHIEQPLQVLHEMVRVCKPGGRIVVTDVFTTTDTEDRMYNRVEKLRDPSHVRALPRDEFLRLFHEAGAPVVQTETYRLDVSLEELLRASMTTPAHADEIRQLLTADIAKNDTGMSPQRLNGELRFSFPIMIVAGEKT